MPPPLDHTLSKPFPGVCRYFYQDIAGVKLVTSSSQMMAFTSLGRWAVQLTRDLEKHTVKNRKGSNWKIKNINTAMLLSVMSNIKKRLTQCMGSGGTTYT